MIGESFNSNENYNIYNESTLGIKLKETIDEMLLNGEFEIAGEDYEKNEAIKTILSVFN